MTTPTRTFARLAAFVALLGLTPYGARAAPTASDPCTKIAGKTFMPPADALACMKAFPFNETLRQNVLTVVSRVFDFYTFEDYYLDSPPPFQESTTNIRAQIARMNATHYEVSGHLPRMYASGGVPTRVCCLQTDYDFNHDLYTWTNQLNDGHTRTF